MTQEYRREPDLLVVLDGVVIADISSPRRGKGRLLYRSQASTPLSISMPTGKSRHDMGVVGTWLDGLLPDRPALLRQWRRQFGLRDENTVSLLRHVGEEVAGAAQFVRPDRLDAATSPGRVVAVDDAEVAGMLRAALADVPDVQTETSAGRFSLAGAQAKIALHRGSDDRSWAVPEGRAPTTHILKPAIPGMLDQEVNEHLSLSAARKLGMATVDSQICLFEDIPTIVVRRYDRRQRSDGTWQRLHQEDLSQALASPPRRKYQSLGGPAPGDIAGAIRRHGGVTAETDVNRFVQALIFNWLIVGTDAHAKNYSLLLTGQRSRLAPLYDLNSHLAYGRGTLGAHDLSMKIGSQYRSDRVTPSDWAELAGEVAVEAEWVMDEITRQLSLLPDAMADACAQVRNSGIRSELPTLLTDRVATWMGQLAAGRF